ncbi:MAG: hypothetical protein JW915_24145 [Chitinispirillaceae bacterium]|nr:hypothetical protein [Chitinispirillaceae bacterium]
MVEKVSKYQMPVSFTIEVGPDINSPVSTKEICINERKYLDYQKIDEIKKEAAIRIKNCIVDAIVKTEAETQLRHLFHDDSQTMPVSHDLVEWFLSHSDEILTKLKVA